MKQGAARHGALRSAAAGTAAALPAIFVFVAVLTIPLGVADDLEISADQLSSWIFAVYALPGLIGLWLALRYRQPLLLTGNVLAIILVASLAGEHSFAQLVGAAIVAGVVVIVLGSLGLADWLAGWIPVAIVQGLLAGAVLPFVARAFTALGSETLIVASVLIGYVAGQRLLSHRMPAILVALVAGFCVAAVTGQISGLPPLAMPTLVVTAPAFSIEAIAGVTPVLVVLMTLQANVPSIVFLRGEGYQPPVRRIDLVSGVGTAVGSLLGPTAVSIPLPVVPLLAGQAAGERNDRHVAALAAGVALVVIGLLAGSAAALAGILPRPLLLALAGLALLPVLVGALEQVVKGSLRLGPITAFVIAQSSLSLFGLGPLFWALVIGLAVTYLLERDRMQARPDEV